MSAVITPDKVLSPLESGSRELTDLQKSIADTALDDNTATAETIAEQLGCNKTTVYKTLQKQHVRQYILSKVNIDLVLSANEAMATQRSLLSSKSDYIRHNAAKDLLDRNEIGMTNNILGQTVNVKIDLS